jgi:hypothetical protein
MNIYGLQFRMMCSDRIIFPTDGIDKKWARVTDELGCEKTTYCPAHELFITGRLFGRMLLLIDRRE